MSVDDPPRRERRSAAPTRFGVHDDGERDEPLLSVTDLRTYIRADGGPVRAVDGVSFAVDRGETVCLVGESGSGKSVTCQSLTGIVPRPPAEILGGEVRFDGTSILGDESRLRRVRGDRIGHVFQNPQHALDPVYPVGEQIVEAIRIHRPVGRDRARERAIELLGSVGIPRPATRLDDHPHEFSGGMRQRVAIAIGLAAEPDLLVADEPMTAVDVTVQARLIELFRGLVDDGLAVLLVTHDLRVVAALADRVLVMFGGTIVERGPVQEVFERPAHPYTQALFASYDGSGSGGDRPQRRPDATASPPDGTVSRSDGTTFRTQRTPRGDLPTDGCRFRGQCSHAIEACRGPEQPRAYPVENAATHAASCVYYADGRDPGPVLEAGRASRPEAAEGDDD